MIRVDMICG